MKTNYFYDKKITIFPILALMALLAASCGSYQSTSYQDRDGIYGSNENGTAQSEPVTRKDYFGAYRIENNDTFTDVENYSTSYAETPSAVAQEESAANYGGWGDDTNGVTVNVYGGNWPYWGWNNYWYGSYWGWNSWIGPSWSIGWGYPYYGIYGWGYPYYGWGWNNYYYGGWNHHHHANHYYSYNNGRRNYYYNNGARGRNNSNGRTYTGTRNNTYSTSGTRTYTPRSNSATRSETSTSPRQYNNNSNNTYSTPRSTAPTRTYSPSSSSTRSSGSSGGGNYGGSSGGSRSGGRR